MYGGFSVFKLVDRRDVFDLDLKDAAIGLEVVPDRLGLLFVVGGARECAGLHEDSLLVEEPTITFYTKVYLIIGTIVRFDISF